MKAKIRTQSLSKEFWDQLRKLYSKGTTIEIDQGCEEGQKVEKPKGEENSTKLDQKAYFSHINNEYCETEKMKYEEVTEVDWEG